MKDPFKDRKNTGITEKRIAWIETIITRLARRSIPTAKAIIPPYPISNCVIGENVSGEILLYMFACRGVINKGLMVLGSKPKEPVTITITLSNEIGSQSKSYIITRKETLVEPNIEVFSRDQLVISLQSSIESVVNEVWTTFLWTPTIKEATVKQFLIDELDQIDVPEE